MKRYIGKWLKNLIEQSEISEKSLSEYVDKQLSKLQEERKDINSQRKQAVTWYGAFLALSLTQTTHIYKELLINTTGTYSGVVLIILIALIVTNLCGIFLFLSAIFSIIEEKDLPIFSELDKRVNEAKLKNVTLNKDILKDIEQATEQNCNEYEKLNNERKWFKVSISYVIILIISSTVAVLINITTPQSMTQPIATTKQVSPNQ